MATEQQVLAWNGVMLRGVQVFSTAADMVVTVDGENLSRRRAIHPAPCLSIDDLELWETIPELQGPPSPLTLVGVLFDEQTAMQGTALPSAFQWRGFAATAMRSRKPTRKRLRQAWHYGVSVLTPEDTGGWRLVQAGGPRTGARRTVIDRYLEEQLYSHVIRSRLVDRLEPDHTGRGRPKLV
jgi:hypothetical protein